MQSYRVEKIIPPNGILQLDGLPFKPDDAVEVIVRFKKRAKEQKKRYPLRGKVLEYEDPFGTVAADDWDVLR